MTKPRLLEEPTVLTQTEAEGLRELLAMLAVFEDRMLDFDTQMYRVTKQAWIDLMSGPKRKLARLSRVTA